MMTKSKKLSREEVRFMLQKSIDDLQEAVTEDNPQVVQDHLDEARLRLARLQKSDWGYSYGWPR